MLRLIDQHFFITILLFISLIASLVSLLGILGLLRRRRKFLNIVGFDNKLIITSLLYVLSFRYNIKSYSIKKRHLKSYFITVWYLLFDISMRYIYQRYNEFLDFRKNYKKNSGRHERRHRKLSFFILE